MTSRPGTFTNPLDGLAVGDPFVLRHCGRFYLYATNDGPPLPDGRAVPVFRSDDLVHWTPLGGALVPEDPGADHWAPEVLAWNGRFFMVVSFGDVDRRGHALWVAVADRPEGPFLLRARVSDPSERFSIDGSWLLDDDGRLYLFRCLDFVEEGSPPYGTGIVVQPMRDPLTPEGPPRTVLRAHAPWHLFQADRTMPLYGGRRFAAWTTIEGPAPVKRGGRYYCGYSGGNYAGAYGTGEAVADAPLGPYSDLRGDEGPLFGTTAGLVEGPGHFSVVQPDGVRDWVVLHGRLPGEPARRVWLCPASWGVDGVTVAALTTRPQSAPPLPNDLSRFDGPPGDVPAGWRFEPEAAWRADGESLRHEAPAADPPTPADVAWREAVTLSGEWVVEVSFRFPGDAGGCAGVAIRSGPSQSRALVHSPRGECEAHPRAGENAPTTRPWPALGGEPFNPPGVHTIVVRARDGKAVVRVDGVVVFDDLSVPTRPARFGLLADGVVAFVGASVTSPPAGPTSPAG